MYIVNEGGFIEGSGKSGFSQKYWIAQGWGNSLQSLKVDIFPKLQTKLHFYLQQTIMFIYEFHRARMLQIRSLNFSFTLRFYFP